MVWWRCCKRIAASSEMDAEHAQAWRAWDALEAELDQENDQPRKQQDEHGREQDGGLTQVATRKRRASARIREVEGFSVGERVLVRFQIPARWFAGRIAAISSRRLKVEFDDNTEELVDPRKVAVRHESEAAPTAHKRSHTATMPNAGPGEVVDLCSDSAEDDEDDDDATEEEDEAAAIAAATAPADSEIPPSHSDAGDDAGDAIDAIDATDASAANATGDNGDAAAASTTKTSAEEPPPPTEIPLVERKSYFGQSEWPRSRRRRRRRQRQQRKNPSAAAVHWRGQSMARCANSRGRQDSVLLAAAAAVQTLLASMRHASG